MNDIEMTKVSDTDIYNAVNEWKEELEFGIELCFPRVSYIETIIKDVYPKKSKERFNSEFKFYQKLFPTLKEVSKKEKNDAFNNYIKETNSLIITYRGKINKLSVKDFHNLYTGVPYLNKKTAYIEDFEPITEKFLTEEVVNFSDEEVKKHADSITVPQELERYKEKQKKLIHHRS
jgi:hypothetical protein